MRTQKLQQFIDSQPNGYWTDRPELEDWLYEVRNGDTRQGFWEWLVAKEGVIEL